MFENILTKDITTFKDIEDICFKFACELAKELMKAMLEDYDNKLLEERDKGQFRNKGLKGTTVKTVIGEVGYNRRMYIDNSVQNGHKCKYLLDEALDIKESGLISENVINLIVNNIRKLSYRSTSNIINELTGLYISSVGVWNIVQSLGEKIKRYEEEKVKAKDEDMLEAGKKETPIIYQEADGVMICLQGTDRKEQIEKYKKEHPGQEIPKQVRNKELKLGMTYEGWEKEGKNRYKLIGKEYVVGYMPGEEMSQIVEANLYEKYNMEKVEMRVLNSDGGNWIRKLLTRGAIYQADSYHLKEKISSCVREQEDIEKLNEMFWNKEFTEMIEYVESLKYKYDGEYEEVEKLSILKRYLIKRKDYLRRYNEDNKVKLKLKEYSKKTGLKYRNMGCQESNNYSILTSRMKRHRMSFKIRSSENLAKVIAFRASESTSGLISKLRLKLLPEEFRNYAEKYIQEIENNIKSSKENKEKVPKENKEIKTFRMDSNPIIRKILEIKPISELKLR